MSKSDTDECEKHLDSQSTSENGCKYQFFNVFTFFVCGPCPIFYGNIVYFGGSLGLTLHFFL